MPIYPTCIRCFGSDSELDVEGVCTTCVTNAASKKTHVDQIAKVPSTPSQTKTRNTESTPKVVPANEASRDATASFSNGVTPLPSATITIAPFKKYSNLQYIDRGGMGIVYKAIQVHTGRTVALKTMNTIANSDTQYARRFKTEGRVLASLSHPGIVQIYDVDEENGLPYFSMEYVSGGTLAKRLKINPRPTAMESAKLTAEIASALAAAHAKKIIHRDIKPSNILISEIGKPKLTDFGLAAFFDDSVRMTNTGAILGTPAYMSPEQAEERFGTVGPLSDVYGLGATLYEMLTGRPPFIGESPVATAVKVCSEPVAPPRTINPKIPLDLERICLKCLEKRPEDRYASAATLANDLTRFIRGEPIGKASLRYQTRHFVRQNIKTATAIFLVLTVFISISVLMNRKVIPVDQSISQKTDSELALADIENGFREGKPISLMNDKGLPRYSKFVFDHATTTLTQRNHATFSDRAAYFQTNSTTLLELCPDNFGMSFRLEATFQQPGVLEPKGLIGVYLKSHDGDEVQRMITADYTDHLRAAPEMLAKMNTAPKNFLNVTDRYILFKPDTFNVSDLRNSPSSGYPHSTSDPKPWKKLVFTVTPGGYEAKLYDLNPNGDVNAESFVYSSTYPHSKTLETDRILRKNVKIQNFLRPGQFVPNAPIRGSIGIFATYSEIAFRNITLTPLP